jgi:hypothetical protein
VDDSQKRFSDQLAPALVTLRQRRCAAADTGATA